MARNPHTLHPATYEKYCAHMKAMREVGLNPRGTHFWRDEVEQLGYFNRKLSKVRFGWHNLTTPIGGYPAARAYDITLLTADAKAVLDDDDSAWEVAAKLGESCGMYSGGLNWGWDYGHFQDSIGITLEEARAGRDTMNGEGIASSEGKDS